MHGLKCGMKHFMGRREAKARPMLRLNVWVYALLKPHRDIYTRPFIFRIIALLVFSPPVYRVAP
jgi:hypothetical protein